jgi:hypothetical protein
LGGGVEGEHGSGVAQRTLRIGPGVERQRAVALGEFVAEGITDVCR